MDTKRVTVYCHSVLSVDDNECVSWDDLYVRFWHGDSFEMFCITVCDIDNLMFDAMIHRECLKDSVRENDEECRKDFIFDLRQINGWMKQHRSGEMFVSHEQARKSSEDYSDEELQYLPDVSVKTYKLNRMMAQNAIEWYLREKMQYPYERYIFAWVPSDILVKNFG